MSPLRGRKRAADEPGDPSARASLPPIVAGVGRTLVRRLTSEARNGVPSVIAVIGPRGAGRTTFVRRAAAFATASRMSVLSSSGSPAGQATPYGVALQLASSLPEGERLPALNRARFEQMPRPVLVQSFSQTFLRAARLRPLALVVDDVQWADPLSIEVLCAVLRRMRSTRMSVVISMTGTAPDVAASCTGLLSLICSPSVHGHVVRLEPHAASASDAQRSGRPARPAADQEVTLSMADSAGTPPLATWTDPTWGMAREPLALLRGIAVCGNLLPIHLVSSLIGLESTSTVSALRSLRASGLVTADPSIRLTGRVSAERVLSAMDDTERQALYERAAELGHRAALHDEELANLLLGARPSGASWVSASLRRVAAACLSRGEHHKAVTYLSRALQEPLADEEQSDLLMEIGTASCMTDPDAGDRFLTQALCGPGRRGDTWRRPTAADLLLARGDAITARRALAATFPTAQGDRRERDSLLALHWFAEDARLDESGLEGILSDMPALPAEPEDPCGLSAAAWQAATIGQDAALARRLGLAALDFPLRRMPLYPRIFGCKALGLTDETDAAFNGLDACLAEARRRQAPPLAGLTLLSKCELHLRRGDTARASRDLAIARDEMPLSSWHPAMKLVVQALEVRVRVAYGQLDSAERIAYADYPVDEEQRFGWSHLLYAQGVLLLAQSRPKEAAARLTQCGRWLLARGWTNPVLLPWRSLGAVALDQSGERAEAVRLIAEEQRLSALWGTRSALGTANLASGLMAEGERALRLLEDAAEQLGESFSANVHALALDRLAPLRDRSGGPNAPLAER